MASNEERDHARRIIKKKRGRLYRLEEQEADFGIATPPEIANEIEDLRRDIARLESIAEPLVSKDPEVRALEQRSGPIDLTTLQNQYVLIGSRVSKIEETQTAAGLWRVDKGPIIDALAERAAREDRDAPKGRRRTLILLLLIVIFIAAEFGSIVWLAIQVHR